MYRLTEIPSVDWRPDFGRALGEASSRGWAPGPSVSRGASAFELFGGWFSSVLREQVREEGE